jgi:hypothetical protein
MPTTQDFLEMEQIRDGIVILKNKGLRGILMVSSLNFALKSEENQNAILAQFQGFLNSLDFSCQILVQSRRLNITGYIDKLKELETIQEEELMQLQTREYRKFIESIVSQGIIMTKRFFVIVPFTIWEVKGEGLSKLSFLKTSKTPSLTEENFQRYKSQLWQRMEFVALGLRRCGLQVVPLTSSEIIELFWSLHHPKEAEVGYFPEIPPEMIK